MSGAAMASEGTERGSAASVPAALAPLAAAAWPLALRSAAALVISAALPTGSPVEVFT